MTSTAAGSPAPRYTASSVSAGSSFACAVKNRGGAMCWGGNGQGQLGIGVGGDGNDFDAYSSVPIDVAGLRQGVSAVEASKSSGDNEETQACAITIAGAVDCWGDPQVEHLGGDRPRRVTGLDHGVSAIAVGARDACALTTEGGVKCWGSNEYGQLGDGGASGKESSVPVDVVNLSEGVSAITAGDRSYCALRVGRVWCWGDNSLGEFGDGTTTSSSVPVQAASGLSRVHAIDAGESHVCAVTQEHTLWCWGSNKDGELGDGTTKDRLAPVAVTRLSSEVVQFSAGDFFTCAVTVGGAAKCWGDWLGLGHPGIAQRGLVPVGVRGLSSGVAAVSAGGLFACALRQTGKLECWGEADVGQLGNGAGGGDGRFTEQPVKVIFFGAPDPCIVPKVAGERVRVAEKKLRQARCAPHVRGYRYSTRVHKGRVIRAQYSPRYVLPHGSMVALIVSKGRR